MTRTSTHSAQAHELVPSRRARSAAGRIAMHFGSSFPADAASLTSVCQRGVKMCVLWRVPSEHPATRVNHTYQSSLWATLPECGRTTCTADWSVLWVRAWSKAARRRRLTATESSSARCGGPSHGLRLAATLDGVDWVRADRLERRKAASRIGGHSGCTQETRGAR